MNRMHLAAMALSTVGLLHACGKPPPPSPKVQDTVFGEMVETKDKVRQQTEQAMEQRQRQLEESMKKNDSAQ
jgi:hypothetical protein